jgi:putative hydrolase of the HAD superfamily
MNIDCIHFDLDSVLYLPADFLAAALKLSVRAMIQYGLRASVEEALAKLDAIRRQDANAADHFDRLCLHFNGEYDAVIIAAGVEKYWDAKQANMMVAPDAHFVLNRLSQRYPLTVISNGIPVKQAGKLIRLGLCPFFVNFTPERGVSVRYVYASAVAERRKPHPYLWTQAQNVLGFSFARSLMVGDRYWADMFGAKRLGMRTVKINQGEHRLENKEEALTKGLMECPAYASNRDDLLRLMEPDYTITNLFELLTIVMVIEEEAGV